MKNWVLGLAIAQFFAPYFHRVTGWGIDIGRTARASGLPSPETPSGYAFSIWFPIFVLGLVYAWRLRKDRADARLAPYAAAMFAAGTAWMLWTQIFGSSFVQLPLIYAMYAATMLGFAHVAKDDRATQALFGLQGGWLTAAVFLNTTSYLREGGWGAPFGLEPGVYALFTLLPAAALALATILSGRANTWFAGAVVWALVAIVVANIGGDALVMGVAAALIPAILLAPLARRRAPPPMP
jgi:O-antigen ligase